MTAASRNQREIEINFSNLLSLRSVWGDFSDPDADANIKCGINAKIPSPHQATHCKMPFRKSRARAIRRSPTMTQTVLESHGSTEKCRVESKPII